MVCSVIILLFIYKYISEYKKINANMSFLIFLGICSAVSRRYHGFGVPTASRRCQHHSSNVLSSLVSALVSRLASHVIFTPCGVVASPSRSLTRDARLAKDANDAEMKFLYDGLRIISKGLKIGHNHTHTGDNYEKCGIRYCELHTCRQCRT